MSLVELHTQLQVIANALQIEIINNKALEARLKEAEEAIDKTIPVLDSTLYFYAQQSSLDKYRTKYPKDAE